LTVWTCRSTFRLFTRSGLVWRHLYCAMRLFIPHAGRVALPRCLQLLRANAVPNLPLDLFFAAAAAFAFFILHSLLGKGSVLFGFALVFGVLDERRRQRQRLRF